MRWWHSPCHSLNLFLPLTDPAECGVVDTSIVHRVGTPCLLAVLMSGRWRLWQVAKSCGRKGVPDVSSRRFVHQCGPHQSQTVLADGDVAHLGTLSAKSDIGLGLHAKQPQGSHANLAVGFLRPHVIPGNDQALARRGPFRMDQFAEPSSLWRFGSNVGRWHCARYAST